MAAIFVSYARQDSEFALRLTERLKVAGADIWLDQIDISAGDRWDRTVQLQLHACRILMVVLSPASVDSENVLDEVGYALEERKAIIPILHQQCTIPFRLRRFQYIDFRSDFDDQIERLLTILGQKPDNSNELGVPLKADVSKTEKPEQGFAIVVKSCGSGSNRISILKALRRIMNWDLKSAQNFMASVTVGKSTLVTVATQLQADMIARELFQAGADPEITPSFAEQKHH